MSSVVTYFVSTGAIRPNESTSTVGQSNIQSTQTNTSSDPGCTGELHKYYSLGFGVERQYKGTLSEGVKVVFAYSFD